MNYQQKLIDLLKNPYDIRDYAIQMDDIQKDRQIVFMGMTPFARKAAQIFKSNGFNVRFYDTKEHGEYDGIPISDTLPNHDNLLTVFCSRPFLSEHMRVVRKFQRGGESITYQRLLIADTNFDSHPYAYTHEKITKQSQHIIDHADEYKKLLEALSDDGSKELLTCILLFRLTYDWELNMDTASHYPHYFDKDIYSLGKNEVFVDGGGFVGDTLQEFMNESRGEFQGYYLFEPEEKLYKKAASVSSSTKVHCFNSGLYNKNGEIHFKVGEGTGNGTITQGGEYVIRTVRLDDCVHEKVSFIKMDVEGSEMEALQGAERIIRENHPKMAICVYHKYMDILDLWKYISSFGNYRFYMRAQYDNVDTEIVLYAI